MTHGFDSLLDQFDRLRIAVIGDAILDTYFHGTSCRLAQEAPVPVVEHCQRLDAAGGAANVAANVASLGARAEMLGATGDDAEAAVLLQRLNECGVGTRGMICSPARSTLAKQRVMAGSQMVVRFDHGSGSPLDASTEKRLCAHFEAVFAASDAVVLSDYGYGTLTTAVIDCLAELQRSTPRVLALDTRAPLRFRDLPVAVYKPNYGEAIAALGLKAVDGAERLEQMRSEGHGLFEMTSAQHVAITLDREGTLLLSRDADAVHLPVPTSAEVCASGCGDTYLAALTLAWAAGGDAEIAAHVATAAAAVVLGRPGTATCSQDDLRGNGATGPRALPMHRAGAVMERHRQAGRRIVLTNGCFDILHQGHVRYLEAARQLGDLLVVGVNTDESIQRLKGPSRPVNSLEDRLAVLSGLKAIDHLVAFGDDTPHRLIETVRPHVFVKGSDYTRGTLPEADLVESLGGEIRFLPFLAERSTTRLIQRIRSDQRPSPHAARNGSEVSP